LFNLLEKHNLHWNSSELTLVEVIKTCKSLIVYYKRGGEGGRRGIQQAKMSFVLWRGQT
jgi:hypothetical protein